MRYADLKKIDRGVRRHFHDDITVVVVFIDPSSMNRTPSRSSNFSIRARGGVPTSANSQAYALSVLSKFINIGKVIARIFFFCYSFDYLHFIIFELMISKQQKNIIMFKSDYYDKSLWAIWQTFKESIKKLFLNLFGYFFENDV